MAGKNLIDYSIRVFSLRYVIARAEVYLVGLVHIECSHFSAVHEQGRLLICQE